MRCARPLFQFMCAGLRCTGERTSKAKARRHLPSLPRWFVKLSRDERPGSEVGSLSRGVMYPFSCTHGTTSRFNPYPSHYRKAFASSTILYPQTHRLTLRFAFPCGRDHREVYGLTTACPERSRRVLCKYLRRLGPTYRRYASPPGALHLRRVSWEHPYLAPYLLVQAFIPLRGKSAPLACSP